MSYIPYQQLHILTQRSAWAPITSAVRGSMNMGIHLNTERPSILKAQTESQIRVWWALISLERLLGDFTGRPSSIDPNVITCPLPSLLCESKFDDRVSSQNSQEQSLAHQSSKLRQTCQFNVNEVYPLNRVSRYSS